MSVNYEATGKLHEVYPSQQVTDKFRKREFVLEIEDGMYPQHIKFELSQDRCDILDNFRKGSMVKVTFNLSGRPFVDREGQTRYFSNLRAWKLDNVGAVGGYNAPEPPDAYADTNASPAFAADDDLPF